MASSGGCAMDAAGRTAAAPRRRRGLPASLAETSVARGVCAVGLLASIVTRVDSGTLKMLAAGTGSAAGAPPGGSAISRGHSATCGNGTPRPRRCAGLAAKSALRQSRSDNAGAGSAAGPATAKVGMFGQRENAK